MLALLLGAGVSPLVLENASDALVPLGVYAGAGNVSGVASFASTTGADVTIASDYLNGSDGWSGMDSYQAQFYGPWQGKGYQMVFGVPIIPSDNGDAVGTLAGGAAGDYNSYFVTLAQTLVQAGFATAYLRLGWEPNVAGYNWSVANATEAGEYAQFWQQIVTSMRSVTAEDFKFVWEGALAAASWTAQEAWPGGQYVDFVGNDTYDDQYTGECSMSNNNAATSTQAECVWQNSTLPILNTLESFAQSVAKPVVIPEWAVATRPDGSGLGDDPLYVNDMYQWIQNSADNVAWTSYFNFDYSNARYAITDGTFPNSLATFENDFGSGSSAPQPASGSGSSSPSPSTSSPSSGSDSGSPSSSSQSGSSSPSPGGGSSSPVSGSGSGSTPDSPSSSSDDSAPSSSNRAGADPPSNPIAVLLKDTLGMI